MPLPAVLGAVFGDPTVIKTIFVNVLIPELKRWLDRRDGELPTEEEIAALFEQAYQRITNASERFFRDKGVI